MRLTTPLIAALAYGGVAQAQTPTQPQIESDGGLSPVCTDRPTKSDSACSVEPGHWQLETDLFNGSFQRLDGVTTDTWCLTNPTLKYGLVTNVDLEVNMVPFEFVTTHGASGAGTESGNGDLYLRLKYTVVGSGPVQIGVVPYVKAPTARTGLGDGAWETGVNMPITLQLNGQLALTFSPEFDALKDGAGSGRHFNTSQTIDISYSLPKGLTVSGELWGDWNADPAGTSRQYSFDLVATKSIDKLFQLDGGVFFGLNRATPGVQLFTGVSRKW